MTATNQAVNGIREALASHQLAVVVGTGVTAAATGNAPTSTWRGLVTDGIGECQASGARTQAWADRAREDAQSEFDFDLIVAAEKATDGLGGRTSPQYRAWLASAVGSLAAVHSDVLDGITALADAGALVLTTNYDDLLAHALGWDVVTWRDPVRLQAVLRGHEQAVVHLHGHWKDPGSVVFGASSYADVLRDPKAVTFLKSAVYSRTMLFVGFGAGLNDPNFASLRAWMRDELSQSTYEHYRLVRDKDLAGGPLHDADERIRAVSYGPDHADLAPFLKALPAGPAPSGLRGLSRSDTAAPAVRPSGRTIAIPPSRPAAADLAELSEAAAELDRIVAIAEDSDEAAAAVAAGGGQRLDEHRRFASLFAEEISEVASMAAVADQIDADAVAHALDWARKLVSICRSSPG
jgi:hypothetical protein